MNKRLKAVLFLIGWPFLVVFVVMASAYFATREMVSLEWADWVQEAKDAFHFAINGKDK